MSALSRRKAIGRLGAQLIFCVVLGCGPAIHGGPSASAEKPPHDASEAAPGASEPPFHDLHVMFLRSWAIAPASPGQLSSVERQFERAADLTKAGRFREAEDVLDGLDRSAIPLVRLGSRLYRSQLEDFRLAFAGGGEGGGDARLDYARRLADARHSFAQVRQLLAALPTGDRRDGHWATQVQLVMSAAADTPAFVEFQTDHRALTENPADTDRSAATSLETSISRIDASFGASADLDAWRDLVLARIDLGRGDVAAAVDRLTRRLQSSNDPCAKAELHVALGDVYVAPFGPVELLGRNPLSLGDAAIALRSSIPMRWRASPPDSDRRRAASEYGAAASCTRPSLRFRLREREAYLRAFDDEKAASEVYDDAARLAADAGSTRDSLRLDAIAAMLTLDEGRLARAAQAWSRSEDVGGRRSILALATWRGIWLADALRDPTGATRTLQAFADEWGRAGRDTEIVPVRTALAVIYDDIGMPDAATHFDEQVAAAQRTIVAAAERFEQENAAAAAGQAQIANSDLCVTLQRLANRLGLLTITDNDERLRTRRAELQGELDRRLAGTDMQEAIRREQDAVAAQQQAIAERRRKLESVSLCSQRGDVLSSDIRTARGLDLAELWILIAACREDALARARAALGTLDPVGPFIEAMHSRDPRSAFQSKNAVDTAAIFVQRAFRAASAAQAFSLLGAWSGKLRSAVGSDPSLARYAAYADLHTAIATLKRGDSERALHLLESLQSNPATLGDPEIRVGVLQALARAYAARGDARRALVAEQAMRIRRQETAQAENGLRPDDPASAELASLEREYALLHELTPAESARLDELQRHRGATAPDELRAPSDADLGALFDGLPDRTLVEVFDLSAHDALVWCGRRGALSVLPLPEGADYWALKVRQFGVALMTEASERVALGHRLFDGMIDVCRLRAHENLVIVGARGPLERALEPQGEVIEQRTVVHAEDLWEAEAPPSRSGGAFVLGANSENLQRAEAEAREVAAILGATPESVNADPSLLLRHLDQARDVHIAADGKLDTSNPYASELSLGPSLHIRAWELFRHTSGARLVTLSACNTGTPPIRSRGYSFASLAHLAGARWVLSSMWRVDDAATESFMTDFYGSAAQSGVSLPEAFRAAAIRLKQRNAKSPSVYAPFALSARTVSAATE